MTAHWGAERIAFLDGLRTPFIKAETSLRHLSALELGTACVSELIERSDIDPEAIDSVVFGTVVPGSEPSPNIARDIVVDSPIPNTVEAHTVSRACATSYQAVVSLGLALQAGTATLGIAGGADSISDAGVRLPPSVNRALHELHDADDWRERLGALRDVDLRNLAPRPPALREPSSSLTMGQAAERMAKKHHISREAQDAFAMRSHQLAHEAWELGRFYEDVMPLFPPTDYRPVERDNLVRADPSLEAMGALSPVFDRRHGTITAASSSPLTDGAAALLMTTESHARALDLQPLGYLRSYGFAAVEPEDEMLIAPAYAIPLALRRAGLALSDIELVDMHEAFSAQVLAVVRLLESEKFALDELGTAGAVGTLDWERFNVLGGSIALGHPFAATGARQIFQTLREMKRRGNEIGLVSACAAGGLGVAMVLETAV